MKRIVSSTLCLLIFYCIFSVPAFADKFRVNNTGLVVDFTSAQQAVESSMVHHGDTLFFESSTFSYGNITLTKRLTLVGPGYFIGQNTETQANIAPAILENVNFNEGSQGSLMTGMTVNSWITVSDTGIILTRNNLSSLNISNTGYESYIGQNFIYQMGVYSAHSVIITNNVFTRNSPCWGGYCLYIDSYSNATVTNNIFCGCQIINNGIYRNNIATGTPSGSNDGFSSTNCTITNNIGASTQYGSSNGNQQNIDMATVFVNTGSEDGKYQLLPDSPAAGAGFEGVDCGIFGNSSPYVLSGMPNLPSVWSIYIDGSSATVKAKSH